MASLAGRREELTQLIRAVSEALGGAGRFALVSGEAGIGKSALAQAAADRADGLGMGRVRGWCMDDPGAPTLWPWRRLARELPGLRTALDALSDGESHFGLVDAAAAALAIAAADRGLVVVVEDLHWADSHSLALLKHLLPEIAGLRVLIIATARAEGHPDSPFAGSVPTLLRGVNTIHLPLVGLTKSEVEEWLTAEPETAAWAGHAEDLTRWMGGNHAIVRDAILAELGSVERVRAHAGVAAALELAPDPQLAGLAAVHWSQVEGLDAAARWRDLADCALRGTLAPERGVELARLALAASRSLGAGDAELAERLLAVARFEWAAGQLGDALASCARGVDLAESAARPDLMADFALIPQGIGSGEVAFLAEQMCRRALAALASDDVTRRARLLALGAVAAAEAAHSSLPAQSVEQTPDALSAAALALAVSAGDPQAIQERTELAARAVALGAVATTTMGALWGHLWQAALAFQCGDLPGVEQAIGEVDRIAARRSSPVARWHALILRQSLAALEGRFNEARAHARAGRALADLIGDLSMVGMHIAFQVQLALLRGEPGEIPEEAEDIIRRAPAMPRVRASLCIIHALQGDLDRARAGFAALREWPSRMPLGPRWAGTVSQMAYAAGLVADADVARTCYLLLLPCARWCGGDGGRAPFAAGSNEYLLGKLAHTFGDNHLAAAHFERGILVDDRIGARPWAALGRLGLAESLVGQEPARTRDVAESVIGELRRLDLPGPLQRATDLIDHLHAAGAGCGQRPCGLSDREWEVAGLVALALSNQQIADRLFLSVRTVESHVRSVLGKLALARRTEVAVWVHTQRDSAARR